MKSTVQRDGLLSAIGFAERLVGKKESLPVLSCALIEAKGKTLTLRATNLEAGIEVRVPATIQQEGVMAVPAGVFGQLIRFLGGDSVTLTAQEGNLSVDARGSKNLIKAIPHDEFPALPQRSGDDGVALSREPLLSALQSVSYAASPSMIRPELGSVFLMSTNGVLTTVATDSFRLAEKTIRGAVKEDLADILVPLKHVQELLYILDRIEEQEVRLVAEESQLSVAGGNVRFVSRTVDAQFPQYQEIIPKKCSTEATLLKADLTEILRKARVFSGGEQYVGFHVYPKRKVFTITARSGDIGEMSDTLDAALSGDDIDINFHIGYLSDCLSSIKSDSLTLGFSGAGRALVIKGASDPTFLYLVMPLNR